METQQKETKIKWRADCLEQFTGTNAYHKLTLYRRVLFTDGMAYLAKEARCYWLCDLIAGMLADKPDSDSFFTIKLEVTPTNSCKIVLDDGNGNILKTKNIGYTDFPLPELKLFASLGECGGSTAWIVMLPSEY